MPAGSELPALPRTWRPLGPGLVGAVLVLGLFAVCAAAWFGFDAETRAKFTGLQRGTLALLGLGICAAVHAMARSRVVATVDRLIIVNGYRRRELDWAQVIAVRMPPGAPWATLDLADGTVQAAMGIQGSDGARAQRAAAELRALVNRP